jgi:DNA-binding response OmpR family regulator/S1-C subfamily serine protease
MNQPPESPRETILILDGDESVQQQLLELLQSAVYDVFVTNSASEGLKAARIHDVNLLLLGTNLADADWAQIITELKGATQTQDIRIIVLSAGGAAERARALDLGADDVVARPWDSAELLARVRRQLRARRNISELQRTARLAEESYQVAQTALHGLAVTERMTRDAKSLNRMLRRGVGALLIVAAVMAGIYLLFFRTARKETQQARALIAQLQSGILRQEDLLERTRKTREEMDRSNIASLEEQKQKLETETQALRSQMANAGENEVAALRKQLNDNTARLARIESAGRVAQGIIRTYSASVCLLHVSVAFRDRHTRQRLRYAGLNAQGAPLTDSEGNPVFDPAGRGPEVRADFFGTGFVVAADGRILTNRHVIEPWWKSPELQKLAEAGVEGVIAEISAYFPGSAHGYRVEIDKISPDADLAIVKGNIMDVKRAVLALDGRSTAAPSGQAVVLMGYATGLDAILARAGEETVQEILRVTGGSARAVMDELARRNQIRPLTTQGHIGDVLPDKLVYDAQTTSGGSGGPVFNREGKVVGINFAVVRGFGGSNFGIPARYAESLLQ